MIIVPPAKIKQYISVDENGKWIHDPQMPKELENEFENFVRDVNKAKEYKRNFK